MSQTKVLIAQIASNGDCLFVTTIARQIKEVDYPGCQLTWMIGSMYSSVLRHNPYVDRVIEIPVSNAAEITESRDQIESKIRSLNDNDFDKIFVTDYNSQTSVRWFGTTRASLFRSYPHKITVPVEPLIYLSNDEVERVKKFADENFISSGRFNIIFESAPQSAQSNMKSEKALRIAERIINRYPFVKVILSSKDQIKSTKINIIDGSSITWRENSELTKYCHLLVGCSSGISWLNTASWSKKIDSVQVIDPKYFRGKVSASMKVDFLYFGIETERLIEMMNADEDDLFDCISAIIEVGFKQAKRKYDIALFPNYGGYHFLKEVFGRIFTNVHRVSSLRLFVGLLPANVTFYSRKMMTQIMRFWLC